MNNAVKSGQAMISLQDRRLIARVAMRQLEDVSGGVNHVVTHLFLHEPFALGYAIGFAEQACRYAKKENQGINCTDCVLEIISQMLGNKVAAASFVSFAVTKKGDRTFERGYDVGLGDMDTWCIGPEPYVPSGLLRHLDVEGASGRVQIRRSS